MIESSKKVGPWRAAVAAAARAALARRRDWGNPLSGPLLVAMTFTLPRPKTHYRTGKHAGHLKPAAPDRPTGYPDLSKLARSTEDALTRILYTDDAQITGYTTLSKHYENPHPDHPGNADALPAPGALIHIWHAENQEGGKGFQPVENTSTHPA
jgi:Holliday junction resolvase RusA-like endonuclease